jgi:hypothetical protein
MSGWMLGASLSGLLMLAASAPGGAQTSGLVTDPVAADVQGPDTLSASQAEAALATTIAAGTGATCKRQLTANVVALDQVFFYNRLGAVNPGGMIYALRRDVVDVATGKTEAQGGVLAPGRVALRADKRPRPLVLRMNVRDCLTINFQNLLNPARVDDNQPVTRNVGVHVAGMQLVKSIADDGSNVGKNASSLAAPGQKRSYTLYAEREAVNLLYSPAAQTGAQGNGGTLAFGLFGAVNVEPVGAEYYRSEVTNADLQIATVGKAPTGQPLINYDAVFPAGHAQAGTPVLKMLQGTEIVRSDLNAIITGPGRSNFPAGTFPPNPSLEPNVKVPQAPGLAVRPREEPFREFTVIFHDEIFAIQAFPGFFNDPVFAHTLHGVKDGFAINYGTGGIGSEILANRLGVGPAFACNDCRYEEFFLTSWVLGDPAMVVDIPANVGLENLGPGQTPPPGAVGPKATTVFYPDDPSNVHRSYIGDHVKFRNLHAGPAEHHIFHLHSHQWMFAPNSDKSAVLDSQAIGPGSTYTYEILFNGSGNRNQTPGDAIFHCHFYPHFAQGMWELWRNLDTFEVGTVLDANGRPAAGSRALPDAEIKAGTPIPAVIPIPTLAMAPMPSGVSIVNGQVKLANPNVNPGFPFFIPAVAGHRPPTPPLDVVDDGGLPRHVVEGGVSESTVTRLDFTKTMITLQARELPEQGAAAELTAMKFHAQRTHPAFTQKGTATSFVTNGQPAKAGAPYADPCIDDQGKATGTPVLYKAAAFQMDMKINKVGWHTPQARILALWGDVKDTIAGRRAPQPLFFRSPSRGCITFHHTNLVPAHYELDDFQVRTPTDIIGQHIHLVKFDVTSSDGSANGWNYEDGTMSPEEVIERIKAINAVGGLVLPNGTRQKLTPKAHPYFGTVGAQTTVQRWYADPIVDNNGVDRTLRTVFTHDHFGPSTHQQVGLYAGLVVEPAGSKWRDSETGEFFGGRFDGGPTSWRADILTANPADSYREFMLEFADFHLAYEAGGGINAKGKAVPDPDKAIIPPSVVRTRVGLPFLWGRPKVCPGGVALPCPEAISAFDPGTFTVNYRNEPIALRVLDPRGGTPRQAPGLAGDLSFAYSSKIPRIIPELNRQPDFYPPLTAGLSGGDPFTPMFRAYQGDKIQIRILVGAHEEPHVHTVNGIKWLLEPSEPRSGWRGAQLMGISEHFELEAPLTEVEGAKGPFWDHLYRPSTNIEGQWQGAWGLLRTYKFKQRNLLPLPNNNNFRIAAAPESLTSSATALAETTTDAGAAIVEERRVSNPTEFIGVCPRTAPIRRFDVTAVTAAAALPGGKLIYNPRVGAFAGNPGPLNDPTALLYVNSEDLDALGRLKPGVPIEPLVLRAAAGDCIRITLRNRLPFIVPDLDGFSGLPPLIINFNANQIRPSEHVGMQPQLLAYDVSRDDGMNVGHNRGDGTVRPGQSVNYTWYAGDLKRDPVTDRLIATPVEFGATNLLPSDTIKQGGKGLGAALVIEPQGATWKTDPGTRTAATVTSPGGTFREFVVVTQGFVNLRDRNGKPICPAEGGIPCLGVEDPADSGNWAINYRTEPMWFRLGFDPGTPFEQTRNVDMTNAVSNSQVGGDPATPVFTAKAGTPVRFRLVEPANPGHRAGVFNLHGHTWQRQPYVAGTVASQFIGNNPTSEYYGVQEGLGTGDHFDIVPQFGAGGAFKVPGDYLLRDQAAGLFDGGRWGIFRVQP